MDQSYLLHEFAAEANVRNVSYSDDSTVVRHRWDTLE
jgi:hypothetical protein